VGCPGLGWCLTWRMPGGICTKSGRTGYYQCNAGTVPPVTQAADCLLLVLVLLLVASG
jgi:hypothetical protein